VSTPPLSISLLDWTEPLNSHSMCAEKADTIKEPLQIKLVNLANKNQVHTKARNKMCLSSINVEVVRYTQD